ncbi:complement factor H-related protein 2-like [Anguilla anguilla]|uniref:complement factor H-related protein 2-like n=1 Tax=Anguilla anguilla TaxID=7936 RepID=UPI0015A806AE|nr:complement factor H-related protein 2-like [Anguilla anguilla]
MKPIHVLFWLTIWRCIDALENGCPRLPVVENADVLDSSLKTNYTDGDLIHFTCRVGYVSSRKITYKCNDRRWTINRQTKCSPKQCELPEDIVNGYYNLVNGTDFVFGTVIKYTCNEGYMLVGRSNTRLCMSEGWSDRVPSCEVVKCLAELNNDNMIVTGLGDDISVSYGHVLHFKCASSDLTLNGEPEVTCLSNGKWSSSFPTCGGKIHAPTQRPPQPKPQPWFSCAPPPLIPFGDIKGLRKDTYRHNDEAEYQCMSSYVISGPRFIRCDGGQWNDPPKCLQPCTLTMEEMERQGIQLKYGPPRKLYVKHKDRVQFMCRYGKSPADQTFIEYCNDGTMSIPSCS